MTRLAIESCRPRVEGIHGILTTTKLQYSEARFQLLGRHHEYLFWVPGAEPIEVSVQLYLNVADHWRLFAYCKRGMLLSVNLTTMREARDIVFLRQRVRLATRAMSAAEREDAAEQLCAQLRAAGFEVSDDRALMLGTFDGRRGTFLDTTPRSFVRDFLAAAVLKGHFMSNKGYHLPGIRRVRATALFGSPAARGGRHRAVPLGLRYRVLERDRGRCVLCGAAAVDGTRLHVDHVIPFSQGGRTLFENLQTLCERCNLGKGNRSTRSHRVPRAGKLA
ncbi:MAG: HNH endonuclease [Sandaracinaceae bacterium]|nr:HNH endonuclease [Sandaracinaceae bacterium]